jgi:hypothetical protein
MFSQKRVGKRISNLQAKFEEETSKDKVKLVSITGM